MACIGRFISRPRNALIPECFALPNAGSTAPQQISTSTPGSLSSAPSSHTHTATTPAGTAIIAQAHREVLERQLERSRLGTTLQRLAQATVVITEPRRFSPLSFPLLVDRTRNKVSSEKLSDRIKRMQLVLERAAG